jgi:predicted TIM-barrel fold metal-dependent hydrolase
VLDQFWFSVQAPETVALELRHRIGLGHIIFATDFPHIECEWPNSRPALEHFIAPLLEDERHLLVAQNVIDFFGLVPEDYLTG